MKVTQHFGLTHLPLGKRGDKLWDDGALGQLRERFQWLLETPGLGLLSGEAGVGKTAAMRLLTQALNPHRFRVIYLAETDFSRIDLYPHLAFALGLEPGSQRLYPRTGRQ
jgi:type II secretory pathway predicted ATPase ExeA